MKKTKQLERYFKGAANHHRISVLSFVHDNPGASLDKIAKHLDISFKTVSEHTKKLVHAGLLDKNYAGRAVEHKLSPYGQKFYTFIKTF